ncbi:MAG: hypothetical protein IT165_25515 [Bryobacterales bacterium]|nr:hypothetical protein [Bryobacterales bacterium]
MWAVLLAAVYPTLFSGSEPAGLVKVPAPGVRYRMNMAMATSAPWVDSNIWRYRRDPKGKYFCDVRGKSVQLAAVEAYSQGVDLSLQTTPEQKEDYDAVLEFLKTVPEGPDKPWADARIASDDGSPQAGEALNLLARRNIFYTTQAGSHGPALRLDSKITNAYEYMQDVREKIGDDKRILRIFGSELTIATPTRDGKHIRLQLVNYSNRPVETLRIRIQGHYTEKNIHARVFKVAEPHLSEFVHEGNYTEFTLEELPLYAVLDFN